MAVRYCSELHAARAARLFSLFYQSDSFFAAMTLPLTSSMLKLPIMLTKRENQPVTFGFAWEQLGWGIRCEQHSPAINMS